MQTNLPERVLALAAVLGAAVFVLAGIQRPLFLDEANSVIIASRGPAGIIDSLSRDNNLPLYYFLLSGWMHVSGSSEIALRSLSALFYLGGCGVAYLLGRQVVGNRRAAAYTAFFYLVSALAVRQAQNIRMYALLGMLAGLAALALLQRAWVTYCVICSIGLLTHVWFAFVLASHGVAVLIFWRRMWWRFGVAGALALSPFALLWLPAFLGQLRNGATNWMPSLTWGIAAGAPVEFYGVPGSLFLFALAAAGVRRGLPRNVAAMLTIFAVSLALPLAISLVRPIYWPGRYTIIALMPLAAALGAVLAKTAPRPILLTVCLLVLGLQVTQQVTGRDLVPDAIPPIRDGDRASARFLLTHAAPGDAVVFTSLTRATADYYFGRAGEAHRFQEISFPAENATHLGWSDPGLAAERPARLEAEAGQTAERLRKIAARGGRVWVYDGFAVEVSGFLKRRLDATLQLHATHEQSGAYHKRVLEYGAATSGPIAATR